MKIGDRVESGGSNAVVQSNSVENDNKLVTGSASTSAVQVVNNNQYNYEGALANQVQNYGAASQEMHQ